MSERGSEGASGSMEKILQLLDDVASLLVPPFSDEGHVDRAADRLAQWIQVHTHVDAASLFLVNESSTLLRCVAAAGYKPEYKNKAYGIGEWALTHHVFKSKVTINAGKTELLRRRDDEKEKLPYTGRCEKSILTGKFLNVVAVPVLFEDNPVGVLKLENKRGTKEMDSFPEEDVLLAQLVAKMAAIIWQQRVYTRLWTQGQEARESSKTRDEYLERVCLVLRAALNTKCCAVFIKDDDGKQLQYAKGIGYMEGYESKVYSMPAPGAPATTLTAHIASTRLALHNTKSELEEQRAHDGLPFRGECDKFIGDKFRNILGVALVGSVSDFSNPNAECLGVLKLENRLPVGTDFSHYDLEICRAFVATQVVPKLRELRAAGPNVSPGLTKLTTELAERRVPRPDGKVDFDHSDFGALFKDVVEIQRAKKATRKDCLEFLGISKKDWYDLQHQLVAKAAQKS
jgi:hypothetical protein